MTPAQLKTLIGMMQDAAPSLAGMQRESLKLLIAQVGRITEPLTFAQASEAIAPLVVERKRGEFPPQAGDFTAALTKAARRVVNAQRLGGTETPPKPEAQQSASTGVTVAEARAARAYAIKTRMGFWRYRLEPLTPQEIAASPPRAAVARMVLNRIPGGLKRHPELLEVTDDELAAREENATDGGSAH